MTARRYRARLRIDEAALCALPDEGRARLLDTDVNLQHPEAQRVTDVAVVAERGLKFLEASYVYIHRPNPLSTSISNIEITE